MKKQIKKLKLEALMFIIATIVFATALIIKGQLPYFLLVGIFGLAASSNFLEIELLKKEDSQKD